ncbi:MAG: TIGR04283 family arsenosugar biosynthesis glycosyltransferase [Holophagales bacterium]|nr:TIGR04283 family arsenosugar biosynthesis glycosyltransferase [Holophagales bacterium]
MRLAIVIPTLDEEQALPATLERALVLTPEVVVSDGGSRDRTPELAASIGARVVSGPAGRGGQLNRGATATSGEVLLFLHADTLPPPDAREAILACVESGCVGGGFHSRYASGGRLLEGLGNRLVRLRTRLSGCPLGDQAQFATRRAFEAVGGFPDWPILEDLELARRLRRHGPTRLLEGPVITSARRFEHRGMLATVVTNWLIWALFFAGVPPHRLARLYRQVR